MKEEIAMKKIYNAPEADLLCFRPVEDLAIDFGTLIENTNNGTDSGSEAAASFTLGDIKINAK